MCDIIHLDVKQLGWTFLPSAREESPRNSSAFVSYEHIDTRCIFDDFVVNGSDVFQKVVVLRIRLGISAVLIAVEGFPPTNQAPFQTRHVFSLFIWKIKGVHPNNNSSILNQLKFKGFATPSGRSRSSSYSFVAWKRGTALQRRSIL